MKSIVDKHIIDMVFIREHQNEYPQMKYIG